MLKYPKFYSMNLKKLIVGLTFMCFAVSISAQGNGADSAIVVPKHIYRSTFIGAAGGANILFGTESLTELKNFARFNANVEVYAGRWFSKSLGARLNVTGLRVFAVDASDPDPDNRIRVNINTINARADLMWHLSNSLGGFNPYRVWNVIPYIGVGYLGMFPKEKTTLYNSDINTIGLTAGLYNAIRISNVVNFTIDLRATVFDSKDFNSSNTNKKSNYATLLSGSAGLSFKISRNWFKKKSTKPQRVKKARTVKQTPVAATTVVSDSDLQAKVEQLEQRAAQLEKQVAQYKSTDQDTMLVKVVNAEAVVAKDTPAESKKKIQTADVPQIVYFEVGRPTIGLKELMSLEHYVNNVIKKNPDRVFTIVGAVDKEQGNVDLAQRRAKYIYDLLKSRYGVKGSQLVNKGAHYSPEYNAANLNRVVIIN